MMTTFEQHMEKVYNRLASETPLNRKQLAQFVDDCRRSGLFSLAAKAGRLLYETREKA